MTWKEKSSVHLSSQGTVVITAIFVTVVTSVSSVVVRCPFQTGHHPLRSCPLGG